MQNHTEPSDTFPSLAPVLSQHDMLPWSDKGGASGSSSSTLRQDENISNSSQYRSTSNAAESSRFRSQQQQSRQGRVDDQAFDTFGAPRQSQATSNNPVQFHSMQQPDPILLNRGLPPAPQEHTSDGAGIQAFLNSTAYTDELYGEDLVPDSNTYLSHRHQMDHQHSIAEQQRQHQWQDLLQAEDIVAYLQEMRYTDDIYGAPPAVEALIKEAQKEVAEENQASSNTEQNCGPAVQRLAMVRNHLMAEARGNVDAAVKQGQTLQQDDWEQILSKGSVL
ncbi:hypothetical protein BDB00DRAFT_582573 [Zychaea mexicana]|uniref:uncharacterized protein n=1 Tax=Zychaea mexicana TaxID=64656 RepID=UPI0022FE4516|nr:uncharacterized protein BDB00DRAFT_582573 [Zychaea mexicana]KAI9497589.1 hypothetical protein BDB00DRAFT_582573 [Zychaea mexicana]